MIDKHASFSYVKYEKCIGINRSDKVQQEGNYKSIIKFSTPETTPLYRNVTRLVRIMGLCNITEVWTVPCINDYNWD